MRQLFLAGMMVILILAMMGGAWAQIAPEFSAGVAIFAAGPPVSVAGSMSQRLGITLKDADFTLDALFLATPGEGSGVAGAVCAKAKTDANMKAGLGYAPGRNTTRICTTNLFVNLQYVKATPAPTALGFKVGDPPISEFTLGTQPTISARESCRFGATYTKRF
jgi:hypothetical protein